MKFRDDATAEQIAAAHTAVAGMASQIPEISSLELGFDLGLRDDKHDLAVVAGFEDEAAYQVYASHPQHVAVIQEFLTPILEGRVGVQFEL